jgi:hypothetical protein
LLSFLSSEVTQFKFTISFTTNAAKLNFYEHCARLPWSTFRHPRSPIQINLVSVASPVKTPPSFAPQTPPQIFYRGTQPTNAPSLTTLSMASRHRKTISTTAPNRSTHSLSTEPTNSRHDSHFTDLNTHQTNDSWHVHSPRRLTAPLLQWSQHTRLSRTSDDPRLHPTLPSQRPPLRVHSPSPMPLNAPRRTSSDPLYHVKRPICMYIHRTDRHAPTQYTVPSVPHGSRPTPTTSPRNTMTTHRV